MKSIGYVWKVASYHAVSDLAFISQKEDSKVYWNVFKEGLLRFTESTVEDTYIYQQYHAALRRGSYSQDWLNSNDVFKLP